MIIYINVDTQQVVQGPLISTPIGTISVPIADDVPLVVKFYSGNVQYDPETLISAVAASPTGISVANPTNVNFPNGHGFPNGATVTFAGCVSTPTINGSRVVTVVDPYNLTVPVNVTVVGGGGTATLVVPLALRFTAKKINTFNQTPPDATIAPGGFIKSGSGANSQFTGQLNLNTTTIIADIGTDPNDVQLALMAEFSWTGINPSKINWFTLYARNDVYKTGDGTPVSTGGQEGKTAITNGASSVTVTLGSPMISANWHFLGSPTISNTVDGGPLGLYVTGLTARSTTAFTVGLSGATDSANYSIEWVIAPD